MKKNKIIIPAMAMILFSTAASISGTVAWFTASRVFDTQVGNFSVVEIDGSLDVKMGAGQGTVLDSENNAVSVINYATKGTAIEAESEPGGAHEDGDLWIDTSGEDPVMMVYDTDDYIAKTDMVENDLYFGSTGLIYKATGTNAISATKNIATNGGNIAVLTHGSYNHANGHGYVIDNDSDPKNPSYIDKDIDAGTNWLQKGGVHLNPPDVDVDIFNVVSWTMTFKYTFAGDSAPIGVYLDLKKSAFEDATNSPNFKKQLDDPRKTSKGFRIGFSEAVYGVGDANPESRLKPALNAHDVVWGNNQYVTEAPTQYAENGTYEKGKIVRYAADGNIYKAKEAISTAPAALDATKWDLIGSLPTYSDAASTKYAVGDKVIYEGAVYQCVTAINTGETFNEAKWYDLSGSVAEAYSASANYAVGQMATFEGKKYRCIAAANAEEFTSAHWEYMSDNTLDATPEYSNKSAYLVGAIVKHDHQTYKCKTPIADPGASTHDWTPGEWELYDGTSDLRYVSSEEDTTLYSKDNYVTSDHGYVKLDNLNANEAQAFNSDTSAPERVCVLTRTHPEVTVKCSAWFEGSDPNVVTGAAMECLTAKMSFYSRTVNE